MGDESLFDSSLPIAFTVEDIARSGRAKHGTCLGGAHMIPST